MLARRLEAPSPMRAPAVPAVVGLRRARREERPGSRAQVLALQRSVGNGRAALLLARPVASGVVQRHKESGRVAIDLAEGQQLHLASADHAKELGVEHEGALRLDLRQSVNDAVADPGKVEDKDRLMLALACRIGESSEDVIVNCKSGKTRTPVIAILHLLMRNPRAGLAAAVSTVAEAFKEQRPGVGIDYDAKLTGVRLLDADGNVATPVQLTKSDRLTALARLIEGDQRTNGTPDTPAEWKAARERFSVPRGGRNTPFWTSFTKSVTAEDERRDSLAEEQDDGAGDEDAMVEDPVVVQQAVAQPAVVQPVVAQPAVQDDAVAAPRRGRRRPPPYPHNARPRLVGVRKPPRRARAPRGQAATIRAWARAHGYRVADRGRLPREVLDAYRGGR
jgi:Lsr2